MQEFEQITREPKDVEFNAFLPLYLQIFEGIQDPTMSTLFATQMHTTQAFHMFSLAFSKPKKETTD